MKIYTKTGDDGTTSLFDGTRVPKNDLRIDAYGDVDELNSCLGVLRAKTGSFQDVQGLITTIQADLFALGAKLANPTQRKQKQKANFSADKITYLEQAIDKCESEIDPITEFMLPGGSEASAFCDLARTVCRRAERKMITLNHQESVDPSLLIYMNRLSDLLFMMARTLNKRSGVKDLAWKE